MSDMFLPDFEFSHLVPRASIETITVLTDVRRPATFDAGTVQKWVSARGHREGRCWRLTLHRPVPGDVRKLFMWYPHCRLVELQVAVDFWKAEVVLPSAAATLMHRTMACIAGRLRPEEAANEVFSRRGYTMGGSGRSKSFGAKRPPEGAHLHWGRPGDAAWVTAFPMTTDGGQALADENKRARILVSLSGQRMGNLGVHRSRDLLTLDWRKAFSPYLSFVLRPEVPRLPGQLAMNALELPTIHAWLDGGAGAFVTYGIHDSQGADSSACRTFIARHRAAWLPVLLVRHRRANELVGRALRDLQEKVRATPRHRTGIHTPLTRQTTAAVPCASVTTMREGDQLWRMLGLAA